MRAALRAPFPVLLAVSFLGSATKAGAAEIRGRLLVGERPASGVVVSAFLHEPPLEAARRQARGVEEPKPAASATTGIDGRFTLSVPPEPAGSFVVRASGGGVRAVEFEGVFDSSETADLGEHVLAAAEALAGTVLDREGRPVPGAGITLLATTPGDDELRAAPVRTKTEADGTFRVEGAAGGRETSVLRVEKKGFAPAVETLARAGALARPVVLAPGTAVSGRLKPLPGKSPAGALVRFEGRAESRWVEAGPDGTFTVADAPAGKGRLVADAGESGFGETTGLVLPLPAGKIAEVALSPPASLEGRVVDAKTLRGLARAKVELRQVSVVRATRSGPDGRYRLAPLPPRSGRLLVDEPRYVPFRRDVEIAFKDVKKVDAALVPGASMAGRVTDENGQPVAGAQGLLARGGESGLAAFVRQLRNTGGSPVFRTAPDGSFRASRLLPGENQRLTVGHPEFAATTISGVNLLAGQTAGNIGVVLRRGAAITGIVRDKDGNPVEEAEAEALSTFGFRGRRAGAVAQLNFVGGPGGARGRPSARTGADGRFEIRGLTAGDYALTVRKPGYASERVDPLKVPEEGSPEPVTLTLGPGAVIAGVVRQRGGSPAEGWTVVASEAGTSALGPRLRGGEPTGPDGFFLLDGLKPGQSYDLQLFGGPGIGPAQKGVVAPADGVEVIVSGAGRIAGRAVDAQTGRPIPEFQVSYEPERTGGGMVFRFANRAAGRRVTGVGEKVDVKSEDGAFLLEEVPPGTWSVVVEAKGYQPARAGSVVVEEGGTAKDVDVKVSLGGQLKGRVLDASSGRPVPNATVTHAAAGAAGGPLVALADAAGEGEIAADADGGFEIDGLTPGKIAITVKHPDYAEARQTADVKEGTASVEVRLTPGSALGGLVLSDARQPLPGADVVLQAGGDAGFGRGMLGSGQSTVTDGSGRFRFDHLTAGRYSLVATVRSRTSPAQTVVLQDGESREDAVLQIAAGATLQGVVSGIPDSWKNGMTVTAGGADAYAGSTRTGADGRFQFAGVPPGPVTLRATAGDFAGSSRSVTKQVEMPDGQPVVDTEIVFEPGYVLSGRVTRAGQPLPNVTVVANLVGGGGRQASSRTDDGGSYRMEGLGEGTYNVMALSSVFGGSTRSQQVDLRGDQTLDIAFPSAKLGGTVVDAQGRMPLADAVVEVTGSDSSASSGGGRQVRQATTDSNGSFLLTDLDPQSYAVNVRKADYLFERRDVTAAEQGTDALQFELTRGEGIGIVGRDGVYGVPLHGLMVRVLDASRATVFAGPISLDGSGRGEIPSLKPGGYTLIASASGYAVTTIPGISVPSAPVTVSLTPGGSVEICSGPKTLATGTARAQVLTAAGAPYPLNLFAPDGTVVLSTAIRRIDNLAPGGYVLAVAGGDPKSFAVREGAVTVVELP